MEKQLESKDKRIKELESTILDLQSELARKKYSLSVACNRVEELEGKLKIAVDTILFIRKESTEDVWHDELTEKALRQLGELK